MKKNDSIIELYCFFIVKTIICHLIFIFMSYFFPLISFQLKSFFTFIFQKNLFFTIISFLLYFSFIITVKMLKDKIEKLEKTFFFSKNDLIQNYLKKIYNETNKYILEIKKIIFK